MKPAKVIRKPQYNIVSDLIPLGITRSASLAKVRTGKERIPKIDNNRFISNCLNLKIKAQK